MENEKNENLSNVSKLDELTKDDVIEAPDIIEGVITSRKIKKASELFTKTFGKPDKEFVELVIENEGHGVKVTETLAYYENPNKRSKLGKFLRRYSKIRVGMKVVLETNEDGFYELQLKI